MNKKNPRKYLLGSVVVLLAALVLLYVWAGTPTAATGGGAISADTAATGGTGAWTSLTGPIYTETIIGDMSAGTVVLTVPTGFAFNTGTTVTVVLLAGDTAVANKNINNTAVNGTVATATVTSSTITFTIFSKSNGQTLNQIKWQGIQVRPLNGYPLASGNITASGTAFATTPPDATNFGTLTEVPGAPKLLTVLPGQTFTTGSGISGAATAQTSGSAFILAKLVAADKFFNPITSYSGTHTISYAGPATSCAVAPSYTTSVSFTGGISTTSLATTLRKVETTTITASDSASSISGTASSSVTVNVGAINKLVVTLPGQTFTACAGNSGTASARTAATAFNLTSISATDASFNLITTYTGSHTLTYTGPATSCAVAPSYTTNVGFTNGVATSLATTLIKAETTTITASEGGIVTGPASSSVTVNPGAKSKLVVTLLGETFTACAGNSGTPSSQTAGVAFNLTSISATDANFNLITSYTGVSPTLTYTGPSGSNSYTNPVSFTNGQSTTTLATTISTAQTTTITVTDGTTSGPASSNLVVGSTVASFNAFESATAANATAGVITTKVSGTAFGLDIVALTSTPAVSTGFTGNVTVELVDSSGGGGCSTWPALVPAISTSQTFTAANQGRRTVAGFNVTNAWKNLRVRISYPVASPTIINCSTDNFAIRPSVLVISPSDLNWSTAGAARALTNTGTGGVVHKAGQPFTITTTAQNSSGATTTNYSAPSVLPMASVLSQCGTTVCPAAAGTLALGTWGSSAGVITTTTATYSEVGSFNVQLQDQEFASVDNKAGDTIANCAGLYVCSAATAVGRFVPDRFLLDSGSSLTAACAAGGFTYMGQPMTANFSLTAVNASGNPTTNYVGSLARLVLTSATSYNFKAKDTGTPTDLSGNIGTQAISNTPTWTAGASSTITAKLTVTRPATTAAPNAGPFSAFLLGIAPSDSDSVTLATAVLNLDTNADTVNESAQIGNSSIVRFGRLWMGNAYGTEKRNLSLSYETQYWNGQAFVKHTLDNCTALTAANFGLGNYQGSVSSANLPGTAVSVGAISGGGGSVTLSAPNAAGSVDVAARLDSSLSMCPSTWVPPPAYPSGTAFPASYLQGKWCGASYVKDPAVRATFGIFGSSLKKGPIYVRESF